MDDLFSMERKPLAARMRPRNLAEFVGQQHILAPGRLLRRAIEQDRLHSLILSGPPGTGKTTLARVIAAGTRSQFIAINAVLSGVKDIRDAIAKAQEYQNRTNQRTILFVDEVHRWNRSQQDALLPWVEEGLVVLVGATTENPWFEVNSALLSRSRVFLLEPLTDQEVNQVLDAALQDRERGYGAYRITLNSDARAHLLRTASGDARTVLNALELAVEANPQGFPPAPGEEVCITREAAADSMQQRALLYDHDGDMHYDTISAFIKAVRGSDPDGALYWLARMVSSGENPRFILRRLVILAAEDIGLADPHATGIVMACATAFDRVGMPEGQYHLAQATLYCATTEKSNTTMGYFDALKMVQEAPGGTVPDHLKDPSRDGAATGHGAGYRYPHAYEEHWVAQQYLPDSLRGCAFYHPGTLGWEGERRAVTEERRRTLQTVQRELAAVIRAAAPLNSLQERWTLRHDAGIAEQLAEVRRHVRPGLPHRKPVPTDRVLLHGSPVQLFLWDLVPVITAGLLQVHCTDHQEYEELMHALRTGPLDDMAGPQVFFHTDAAVESHPGPFDWIILRPGPGETGNPRDAWSRYSTLLAPGGTLSVIEIDPSGGTRPSDILQGPEHLLEKLRAAEDRHYGENPPQWYRRASREHPTVPEAPRGETVEVTLPRTIDGTTVAAWLQDTAPLGTAVEALWGRDILQEVRQSVQPPPEGHTLWRRRYCISTFPRP